MTRTIDTDGLKLTLRFVREDNPHKVIGAMIDYFEEIVDCQPTVDAIPISFIKERMEGYYKNSYTELGACLETLIEDWRKENEID